MQTNMARSTLTDWIRSRSNTKPHHAVALVALSLVILGRWWLYLTSSAALGDESIYLQAFQAVASGSEPGPAIGFYYPKTFAVLGGWLLRILGEVGTRSLLRGASVLGLAITVWLSACLCTAPWSWRLALSSLYVSVSPAVYYGIETGNLSFTVAGAILLALTVWSIYPVVSGVLLGGSTAIKPLAPLAILALTAHRPVPDSRKHIVAGVSGGVLALAFLSMNPAYLATTSAAVDRLPFIRSISLNRILILLGLETSPVVIALILGFLIVVVARSCPMPRQTMLCFGGVAAVLAVPIIWSHTLLLTLPVQVLALTRATSRRREVSAPHQEATEDKSNLWRRYELAFVLLAVAALQLTGGAGAVDDQSLAFQLIVLTGAYLAAPALIAYVLATDRESRQA